MIEGQKMHDTDFCYCNSGKLYKDCCKIREIYKPNKLIGFDKRNYLKKWTVDSNYFKEKNYYNWMTEKLYSCLTPKRILDIGCGTGNGIIELLKNNNIEQIISIEDNTECIKQSLENIKKITSDVSVIYRGKENISKKGLYFVDYSDISEIPDSKVILIEGDILLDSILINFLLKQKFDAITCWLIGTHISKNSHIKLFNLIQSNSDYRLRIENKLYEIADKVLNENGVLQIVDRIGYIPSEEYKNSIRESHEDQASVTELNIYKIDFLEYEPLTNGIPMIRTGINNSDSNKVAFVSVISSHEEVK